MLKTSGDTDQMRRPLTIIWLLALFLVASSLVAADKQQPRALKIDRLSMNEMRVSSSLITADTCIVRHDIEMAWRIDDWVFGNELYKSYLDPSLVCPDAYPFVVTEIHMPMIFGAATVLYASVDVEAVNLSVPNCPFPDSVLSISSEYRITIPEAGLWDLVIPLDDPVTVTGPFFAGFFIGNAIGPEVGAAVITDNDATALCRSYNIWDETIGYIDLLNNNIWNFPGRLVLFASGIPGGAATIEPEVRILSPEMNEMLYGYTTIWAQEKTGSSFIDYVSFEYAPVGGQWVEIGRDYDGSIPLRDGLTDAGSGDGFVQGWNFSTLTEGEYILRATAWDSQGPASSDTITIQLEPTPPVPQILAPLDGTDICPEMMVLLFNPDDNLSYVDLYRHDAQPGYSSGLELLSVSQFGDADGDPSDGNAVADGEFSEYYSAPVAAGLALKKWADRGYAPLIQDGVSTLSTADLVERLADNFQVRANGGASDDNVMAGLLDYNAVTGNLLRFGFLRDPDYFAIRRLVEDEEQTVMIALGGTPGVWMAVDGFAGFSAADNAYVVRLMNPLTGLMIECSIHSNLGITAIKFDGVWKRLDLLISIGGRNWDVPRIYLGRDDDGSDGWAYLWSPGPLEQGNSYFLRVEGTDATGLTGGSSVYLEYDCSAFFVPGDYDNSGSANISDLSFLIAFLTSNGPAPIGGGWRADANCDNRLNITDIVYFMNFLFGSAAAPCH